MLLEFMRRVTDEAIHCTDWFITPTCSSHLSLLRSLSKPGSRRPTRRAGYSVGKVLETVKALVSHNARHVTRGSATLTSNDVTRAVILYDFMSQVSQASLRTSWRVIET